MDFLAVLAVVVAACLALRNPIQRYPAAFYVLAITVDVVFLAGLSGLLPRELWTALLLPVQKCYLALALFVVVMFIGVLPRAGRVSSWLRPVRAQLSILACLLAAGHMAAYLTSYVPRLAKGLDNGSLNDNVVASLFVALVLLALVVVLGATSLSFVKQRMRTATWKRIQQLSYPFFVLVYAHLAMMLGPAASNGRESALGSMAVYSAIFAAYVVLRVVRAVLDRRAARRELSARTADVDDEDAEPQMLVSA